MDDREAANASRSLHVTNTMVSAPRNRDLHVCAVYRVLYEWNWSQDVDLVLSSLTHINAVIRAVAACCLLYSLLPSGP